MSGVAVRVRAAALKGTTAALHCTLAVMGIVVIRQTVKSAKMILVSGLFQRICIKFMLKT